LTDDGPDGVIWLSNLIERARTGDREAMGQLFTRYERYLRLVIGSSMGPGMRRDYDASDVLQETLIIAAARFANFSGSDERELLTWLRTLASRKLIDLARRTRRLKRAPADQISLDEPQSPQGDVLAEHVPGDFTSPSQAAAQREMAVKLADALGQIDHTEAQVIWMHHVEGMSFEAIGERIGIGRNGVRGIWTRGLRNLRGFLPGGSWGS
jgi:RNA polymerase sigma-70 factor, ECF subfamily